MTNISSMDESSRASSKGGVAEEDLAVTFLQAGGLLLADIAHDGFPAAVSRVACLGLSGLGVLLAGRALARATGVVLP